MPSREREYESVARRQSAEGDRSQRLQAVVDALWDAFHDQGYSWVGFYLEDPEAAEAERLVLGPRRDKAACSPIGLHGACGKAYFSKQTLIVHDVAELGADYIACDPRDRSEIVIPLIEDDGSCWAVLDVDSFDLAAFDERDADGLRLVLCAADLRGA